MLPDARWILAALLSFAVAAHALDGDLQLYRLGSPDPYSYCGKPDGSCAQADETSEPGDPNAQVRFARLAMQLAMAIAPHWLSGPATTGEAGMDIGVSMDVAEVNGGEQVDGKGIWPTVGGTAPSTLLIPTLHMRKGLPFSIQLGADVGWIAGSSMVPLTAEAKVAPLEGLHYTPDLAVRGFATHLVGAGDLNLTVAGVDVGIGKAFSLAGVGQLTPYAGWTHLYLDAASGLIDFRPDTVSQSRPYDDERIFHEMNFGSTTLDRYYLGLRFLSGALALSAELSLGSGTNPDSGTPVDGQAPVSVSESQTSFALQVGTGF